MKKKKEFSTEGFLVRQVRHKFQLKVLVGILVPVVVLCIITNLAISALLGHELFEKRKDIERGYLSVIDSYLEDAKNNLDTIALYAESSSDVRWAMRNSSLDTVLAKGYALDAQKSLSATLSGSPVERYVDNMFIISSTGMLIAVTPDMGMISQEKIMSSPLFEEVGSSQSEVAHIAESVVDEGETKLVYLYPLDMRQNSYIYIEVNEKLITDLLEPYSDSADIVVSDKQGSHKWYSSRALETRMENGGWRAGYEEEAMEFGPFSLSIAVMTDTSLYSTDNIYVFYVFLITAVLTLCIGVIVSRLVSKRITQPLRRLSAHINSLSEEKTFTVDKSIEEGEDEIAEIGREFNNLVRHINSLIRQQRIMYEQRQKLEINALQAQINPHFLYNTLDSVRWMAVMQRADSIANTVMSLENLLRNMAKGSGDRITLREELSLAEDYVKLQQVRYVEIFDYICDVPEEYQDCLIVKMTLQPVIENAIFHGIEPTGTYGEIRVYAREEQGDLYIVVEDNGMGMDESEIAELFRTKAGKKAMSGIGVANVDERLKMNYGRDYGLSYESEKGKYTRAVIHIPKEKPGEKNDRAEMKK